jgi:hypothetical protein
MAGLMQSLGDEEIVEIISCYRFPNSWKSNIARQGFDPVDSGIAELQSFCHRLEDTIPEFLLPAKTKTSSKQLEQLKEESQDFAWQQQRQVEFWLAQREREEVLPPPSW